MAYTVSRKQGSDGDKRRVIIDITADAATQTVESGLSVVEGHAIGIQSCSTAAIKVYANSNASGVQSMGVLGISGCVSGDEFYVICYGR